MKNFKSKDNIKVDTKSYANIKGQEDHRDKGDCTVRTFSVVMDCSYDKAKMFMAANGRQYREGMSLTQLKGIFNNLKKSRTQFYDNPKTTVAKFAKDNPKGRFYIVIDKHALALIDGVIYDWDSSSVDKKLVWACKVDLNSEVGDEKD